MLEGTGRVKGRLQFFCIAVLARGHLPIRALTGPVTRVVTVVLCARGSWLRG